MKKKILFTLILLLCATIGWAQDFVEVSTLDELKSAIQNNNAAQIKLVADIDISNLTAPLCATFRGTINGAYDTVDPDTNEPAVSSHILTGKHYKKNTGSHESSRLFDNVEDATFESIFFSHIRVQTKSEEKFGLIARTAVNSHFNTIMFDSCSVFSDEDYVGFVAGTAKGCSFENVFMQSCDITTDATYAGGIAGQSENCEFTRVWCGTATYVFADGGGVNANSGGIIGHSTLDRFTDCLHMGIVGGNDNKIGGIAGFSSNSNFMACSNVAAVVNCKEEKFREICDDRNQKLASIDEISLKTALGNTGAAAAGASAIAATLYFTGWVENATYMIIGYLSCLANDATWSTGMTAGGLSAWGAVAITAVLVGATVWWCYYQATGDDYIGGIVGIAENCTIEQCSNYGFVSGIDQYIGGVAGYADGGIINNCLNVGIVHQERDNWVTPSTYGGIVGTVFDTKITNCLTYSSDPINGGQATHGNRVSSDSGNNYRIYDKDAKDDAVYEMSVSKEYINNGTVALWLNNGVENREQGVKPWHQNLWTRMNHGARINRDEYPMLIDSHDEVNADLFYFNDIDDDHIHIIKNAENLKAFAEAVNGGKQYEIGYLDNDIDMTGISFTPIGKNEAGKHFRGLFNGQGHTIKGLKVNIDSDEEGAGLFGVVHSNVDICNVIIDSSCEFTNTKDGGAAGIVGLVYTGWNWSEVLIENCASYASVSANKHAGGILGRVITTNSDGGLNVHVYVNNCYNMGTITATNGNSGLLCGYVKQHGHISNCWSAGSLKTTNNSNYPFSIVNPKNEYEYLAGYDEKVDIQNCYILASADNIDCYDASKMQSGVTAIDASDITSGKLTYHLNGSTNDATKSLAWQQNLGTDLAPVFGNQGVYHTRSVSNEYGTVCLPFPIKSNEDVAYYRFAGANNDNGNVALNFDYADNISAGEPVLFRALKKGELTFVGNGEGWSEHASNTANPNADWHVAGTYERKVFDETTTPSSRRIYYVSGGAIKNGKTVTINPFRAYFGGPSIDDLTNNGSSSARVSIVIDGIEDETSALQLVADDLVSGQDSKTYTLYGTEAGEGYRGIVIRGGKKVINLK